MREARVEDEGGEDDASNRLVSSATACMDSSAPLVSVWESVRSDCGMTSATDGLMVFAVSEFDAVGEEVEDVGWSEFGA